MQNIYHLMMFYLQDEGKTLNTRSTRRYFLHGQKSDSVSVNKKITTKYQQGKNEKERYPLLKVD